MVGAARIFGEARFIVTGKTERAQREEQYEERRRWEAMRELLSRCELRAKLAPCSIATGIATSFSLLRVNAGEGEIVAVTGK